MKKYKVHIGIAVGSVMWLMLNSIWVLDVAQALYVEGEMAAIDAMQWGMLFTVAITAASFFAGFFVAAFINDFWEK